MKQNGSDSYPGTRVLGYPGYPALFLISGISGNAVGYPGTRIYVFISKNCHFAAKMTIFEIFFALKLIFFF